MTRILSVAAAAMLASQAIGASHHAHKRDVQNVVVTVQKVAVVTVTAGAENAAAAAETSVVAVETTVPADAAASVVAAASSAVASSAAAASSSSSSSSGSGASVGSAGALGVTYSPYSADGQCKSQAQVSADLAKLTGYSIIRLYGVDCNQVALVNKAKASGQKLFLGLYFMDAITSGVQTMAAALGNDWSDVHTVSVGNELVNNGQATVSQVSGYVAEARSALKAAGYTGPVVAVDTFIATINNPGLCSLSDYSAVNAHAFFDGGIAAADSGAWVAEQIQRVKNTCGKDVLVVESGWPSKGQTNGAAVPSESNQQSAIASIKSAVGASCLLFNAFNDLWKADGSFSAEKYWGILGNGSS